MVLVGAVRRGGVITLTRRFSRIFWRSVSTSAEQEESPSPDRPLPEVDTNVSGLKKWHYRKYHGKEPEVNEETTHLMALRSQRKIWALYGSQTGISPAIGWPVKVEWEDRMEYEALASPDTLQDMVHKFQEEKKAKEEAIQARMDEIDSKMANLEKWKKEILEKKRKKERDLQAAKDRHDQLIEEVREYLGYRVDTKDPRFKDILEQKELEEKKRAKEAKKKEKQAKSLAKLQQMADAMLENDKPADGS